MAESPEDETVCFHTDVTQFPSLTKVAGTKLNLA